MTTLNIATFNCENLFSRPKILNFENNEAAREPLNELVKLNKILGKAKYGSRDKQQIITLLEALKDFVDLNEMRNKLIGRRKVNGKFREQVVVEGRADWVGGLALKRDPIPTAAQKSTAAVIGGVNADVQCIVEVEDRRTLDDFSGRFFKKKSAYPFNVLIDGNDPRGIDVGLISRHPLGAIRTHVFDKDPRSKRSQIFSRDCLEVEILLPGSHRLHVLVNHFKSKGYGSPQANDARRKLQADQVAKILDGYDLKKDLVAVAGDFNDTPGSAPLRNLLKLPHLSDVLALAVPEPRHRWTYRDKSQIDYLLVSKPLADRMKQAGVERRGLFDAARLTQGLPGGPVESFPTVTSDTNDASDHAAVWAQFVI